jgi:signal transduction histidine kinase
VRVPGRIRSSLDVVLALALTSVVVTTVAVDPHLTPKPVIVPLGVLMTIPLAVRRRYPAAIALLVVVAYALMNGLSHGPYPPDTAVLPAMVAVFTGAMYTRGRKAWVVGIATFAGVEVAWLLTPDGHIDDFLPWILWGGPFGVGRLTRRRDATVSELTLQTRLLEAERAAAELDAARRERDRIARELHDVISHGVSTMVVQAGAERLEVAASGMDAERTTAALARIERAGREALTELRLMLGVLRGTDAPAGAPAAPQPTLDAVQRDLIDRLAAEGVDVRLEVVGKRTAIQEAVGLAAYRILQEGLTNAVKHSDPGVITVRIEHQTDAVVVSVISPCGYRPNGTGGGYGLIGARERATNLGGQLYAAREQDRWVLSARLPCPPPTVGRRA